MLIKQRKQFNSTRQGGNLFTDIISKITSAATSETGKKISKAALDGVSKGVEEGSKQLIRKATNKVIKQKAPSELVNLRSTLPLVASSNIDSSTRRLLDSLKSGSGIKALE